MKNLTTILTLTIFVLTNCQLLAQVKFNLTFNQEENHYQLSVIPETDFLQKPYNITGTGQVTIKVPTGQFEPTNIQNGTDGLFWSANSRTNSPMEEPDYDYISFGLTTMGDNYPIYKSGEEMILFTFENAYGCNGPILLMNNQTDAFKTPNSSKANVGNQLTIFGAGGCAYKGNLNEGIADCNPTTTSTNDLFEIADFKVYPNPTSKILNLTLNWKGEYEEVEFQIMTATGKIVLNQNETVANGKNQLVFEVADLSSGSYFVELILDGGKMTLDRFMKQ